MKSAEEVKSEFQRTHDMLTEQLEKALSEAGDKLDFAESLRASIWTVEWLTDSIGVDVTNNFNPLA